MTGPIIYHPAPKAEDGSNPRKASKETWPPYTIGAYRITGEEHRERIARQRIKQSQS
jgi:hypothetical protein